ncbi:MAG: DnaB-like helicase C-terminal domain-containing protein, partial [Coriobacteriales bacterium]
LYAEHLLVNATPNIKLADLKGLARTMARRGAKLIVVDYLTLIQHGDSRMPRHERVGEVSKSLKGLARELNVPVIAHTQLARTAEGQMPNLAELRQSGEIEEDADLVMLLHRERDEVSEAIQTSLIVAKNRNGPCGTVRLMFRPRCGRFDLEEQR